MQIDNNVNAMKTYSQDMDKNAQNIASKTTNSLNEGANQANSGITRDLTDSISTQNGFDAQVKSINTQNQMMGNMLDIMS